VIEEFFDDTIFLEAAKDGCDEIEIVIV